MSENLIFEQALNLIIGSDYHSYRPQILVLTGNPAARACLVDFAWNLTKGKSLLLCGYILQEPATERIFAKEERIDRHFKKWMQKRNIQGELVTVASGSVAQGTSIFMQTVGLGLLKPNVLMMGFKTNWIRVAAENMKIIVDYYQTIEVGFSKNVSLVIFRNSDTGLDFSESMKKYKIAEVDLDVENIAKESDENKEKKEKTNDDAMNDSPPVSEEEENISRASHQSRKFMSSLQNAMSKRKVHSLSNDIENKPQTSTTPVKFNRSQSVETRFKFSVQDAEQQQLLVSLSKFHTPVKNGRVDVWWMHDNGGFALLLPSLLTQIGSYLQGANIRVFVQATENANGIQKNPQVQARMSKMRAFSLGPETLQIINSFDALPQAETERKFKQKLERFTWRSHGNKPAGFTTPIELQSVYDKTERILRISELMHEHSRDADLIAVTLPKTRVEEVSPCVFLSWLDILSEGLPPVLMVKGNNDPAYTYFNQP
ncbi:unnamed protein product, partial [Mesorhabditis belari]|uniref:SLC12A transporter C-terminal domain-containing protein n=1 Tax=Mesorhabditis belari TaxID=2138241 RepID=A0AAF3FIA2_9BILA